ncbi:MAG: AAA family ATPase [Kaistella sp.]
MKLAELAKELKISTESIIKFIQDFDLELSECIKTNFEVKEDFVKFARENIKFLKKYEKDLEQNKSVEDIAGTINKSPEKVAEIISQEKPKLFDNGMYRSSVSSFGIDHQLGGNYQFVYDYFGKKTNLRERDFIGYRDLFFHISKALDPFINNTPLTDWGIHKPAGIILYGPPGSGKIFWATKIAEIIGYHFKEVKKYYLGTSFVDGQKTSFNDFLIQMMKEEKVLLFMDEFDEIMSARSEKKSVSSCDEETKEIILHYISRFEEEDLVMVGSANSVATIDKEILAPGRFDVMIPVFPPNARERSEMILYFMTEDLSKDSLLMKILIANNADHLPFWEEISSKMKVFSNTMIVDFTQSLKKRIRNLYLKDNSEDLKIDSKLLNAARRDASAKLTEEYLNQVGQFISDVTVHNYDDFPKRITALKSELDSYKVVETPRKVIGFQPNKEVANKK